MKEKKDFVIVKIKNSQEKVSIGQEILVNKIDGKEKDKLKFDEVLLSSKGGEIQVGKPTVKGEVVEAEILEQTKGEKVTTRTYKAKARTRRVVGNRALLTKIKITKI
ncbi:50S ribosomal protein L21 [Candidatus Dojkabacteria bacterium]|nr:50S ribosomal protein L21 [Candidatus Dojkabacteria bacterium]